MKNNRGIILTIILVGITSGLSGLAGNIASGALPESWSPYLWIAWPFFFVFTGLGIGLAVWQYSQEHQDPERLSDISGSHPTLWSNSSPKTNVDKLRNTQNNNVSHHGVIMDDTIHLRNRLLERSSLSDLKDICLIMKIDYDNYPTGKQDFVRDLLSELVRQSRTEEFVTTLNTEKPWVLK